MKANVLPNPSKKRIFGKTVLIIIVILIFMYIIGLLQEGTDDKPNTQKRTPHTYGVFSF